MKFSRFDYLVWGAVVVVGLAIVGVLVVGDQVGARAARTFPNDGGEVGGGERIGIEFAQPMQTGSVEGRFSIEPPVPGKFVWEGQTLWFVPSQLFQRGTRYTARLSAGALSESGQELKRDIAWSFGARAPWIVYAGPATGQHQLWRVSSEGGEAAQLTSGGQAVFDFAVAPDGTQVAYSLPNDQNGIDLWTMSGDGSTRRLLIKCGPDLCAEPAWSPDGSRLVYSLVGAGLSPGSRNLARIWILDLNTNQTTPLYEDPQVIGSRPSWSPDGGRIAFYDAGAGAIRILNLQTREEAMIESFAGEIGAWRPDGTHMLFSDLDLDAVPPFIGVYEADTSTGGVTLALGPESGWEAFTTPALSPDGQWMVIGLRTKGGTGKQLWLMRPDGSEARAITDDPQYTNDGHRWDPWGQAVVFQRIKLETPNAAPEIVVWRLNNGRLEVLAQDATGPAWMP